MENVRELDSVWKRIRRNFIFSNYIHGHPFTWNERMKTLQVVPVKSSLFAWYANALFTFLYCCFAQFRSVQVFLNPESSIIKCVLTQLMAFYYITVSMMQPVYVAQRQVVVRFVNNHIRLLHKVHELLKVRKSDGPKLYGRIVLVTQIFQTCTILNSILLVLNGLLRPGSPELLSSLVPNASRLGWPARMIFATAHAYILQVMIESFLMLAGFLGLTVLSTASIIAFMRYKIGVFFKFLQY